MQRAVIVSASDAKYFDLLTGMLESVEVFARADHIDLAVFDLGLSKSQRTNLMNRGIQVKNPGWDYDLAGLIEPPQPFFMAMTARPHLPAQFPGYDHYVWLDADVWVQDWAAVQDYIGVAKANGVAATAECDRSYNPFYSEQTVAAWRYKCFRTYFPEQTARELGEFPIINSGAFCARVDSPLWQHWSKLLGEALLSIRRADFFSEQTVFNAVLRAQPVPSGILPARYNWMCNRALPAVRDDGTLCNPSPPFEPLGIVHLTADTKRGEWPLPKVSESGLVTRSLRFQGRSIRESQQ